MGRGAERENERGRGATETCKGGEEKKEADWFDSISPVQVSRFDSEYMKLSFYSVLG